MKPIILFLINGLISASGSKVRGENKNYFYNINYYDDLYDNSSFCNNKTSNV